MSALVPLSSRQGHSKEQTGESTASMTPSFRDAAQLAQQLERELGLEDAKPEVVLNRTLSIMTQVSTASSFAIRQQEAVSNLEMHTFHEIGRGGCGIIFEEVGTGQVCKKSIQNDLEALWNDFKIHTAVAAGFADPSLDTQIKVPRVTCFRGLDARGEAWWLRNAGRFPKEHQDLSGMLFSERILPLPEMVRTNLIEMYCKANGKMKARESQGNKQCLVRLYLGARRRTKEPLQFFNLKNFKLHLDQMEELKLDIAKFSNALADALAILHWRLRLDAKDIEFVLGSEPLSIEAHTMPPTLETLNRLALGTTTALDEVTLDFKHRMIHIWLLDFNECAAMPMNAYGVDMAVQAFVENAPYYPRPVGPTDRDRRLWVEFRQRYLQKSATLGNNEANVANLPQKFIDRTVDYYRKSGRGSSVVERGDESSSGVSTAEKHGGGGGGGSGAWEGPRVYKKQAE